MHLGLVRVAPFVVLGHRQRQVGIEHGIEHVDEGHLGDRRTEQFRAQVEHGTDQQAAGTAAADGGRGDVV